MALALGALLLNLLQGVMLLPMAGTAPLSAGARAEALAEQRLTAELAHPAAYCHRLTRDEDNQTSGRRVPLAEGRAGAWLDLGLRFGPRQEPDDSALSPEDSTSSPAASSTSSPISSAAGSSAAGHACCSCLSCDGGGMLSFVLPLLPILALSGDAQRHITLSLHRFWAFAASLRPAARAPPAVCP